MSLTGKSLSQFWKDLLQTDAGNTGLLSTKRVKTGNGTSTPMEISTSHLTVKPKLNTTATFGVESNSGATLLNVSTSDMEVKAGTSQHIINTQYKEFGLFDFNPTAGYHQPMITSPMMVSDGGNDIQHISTFGGNGSSPSTTLTTSSSSLANYIPACAWWVSDLCKIDIVRLFGSVEDASVLTFSLMQYDMDTSSDYGDLSGGESLGSLGSMTLAANECKTDTMVLSSESTRIAANKVIIMFCESSSTEDYSVKGLIKYHLI